MSGTPKWMAPEVKGHNPKYGHPADIFGFGLVAVYVKTGDEPEARPEGTEMTGKNVLHQTFFRVSNSIPSTQCFQLLSWINGL